MIWADVHEHVEQKNRIPGVVQVFGHTQMDGPLSFSGQWYCLDCRRNFALDRKSGRISDLSRGEALT